jgi:hypothetical protein
MVDQVSTIGVTQKVDKSVADLNEEGLVNAVIEVYFLFD